MIQRRHFTAAILAAAMAFSMAQSANAATPYKTLEQPVAVSNQDNKAEVIEFFWYNCPSCYSSYHDIKRWEQKNADSVKLKLVPVQFRAFFEQQQRLFYTLEAMNALEEYHYKVFQAIHEEHKKLDTQKDIYNWIENNTKLDIKLFRNYYESMPIAQKAKQAKKLQDDYKVQASPSFGVIGKYYVDAGISRPRNPLDIVDELIKK